MGVFDKIKKRMHSMPQKQHKQVRDDQEMNQAQAYIGHKTEEPFLLFAGSADSFANEQNSNITIQFKVVNTTAAKKKIALFPAYYDILGYDKDAEALHYHSITAINNAGHAIDCVLDAGEIFTDGGTPAKTVEVIELEGSIREFIEFCRKNPTRIVKTRIECADRAAYASDIVLRRVNPFKVGTDELIKVNQYFGANQFQTGIVDVETDYQLDNSILALWTIPDKMNGASTVEVTFTLSVGAILSTGRALSQMALAGYSNLV